jgi:hypothetical protein
VSTPLVKTVSVGIDRATFWIWDVEGKVAAEYIYEGKSAGIGFGLGRVTGLGKLLRRRRVVFVSSGQELDP